MNQEPVVCKHCGNHFDKDDLQRSCGNCFACLSCEIYVCPICAAEIVVRPMRRKGEVYETGNSK